MTVTNIAAYQFAPLHDLAKLRTDLQLFCKVRGLKGTILLSQEGVNLFVAGQAADIEALLNLLRSVRGLEKLTAKYSTTDEQPFSRMLVRIKKEIIAFGVAGIDPAQRPAPRVTPQRLRRWLDEGRQVTLLDTRNDYEVKLGTFQNALPIGISHFREFPAAVNQLPDSLKEQTVVTFCTGGIRCEKAGPYLQSQGYKDVYQLDGGILKYFEECGSAHYDGACFVFDQRVGLDPALKESGAAQCFVCLTPLSAAEQADDRYVVGESCPHCYRTQAQRSADTLLARRAALQRLTQPQPGSVPRDNLRPLSVPKDCDGLPLVEVLCRVIQPLTADYWRAECRQGRVLNPARQVASADAVARAGERYFHVIPQDVEPAVSFDVEWLYEDAALLVLSKPAPLPMHPAGRFNRNTLQFVLESLYHPHKPRPVHRLDANTTGVLVVARTRQVAGRLQAQFAQSSVRKTYLLRVIGHPRDDQFECRAMIAESASKLGTRTIDAQLGIAAHTQFKVIERNEDGTTTMLAQPITGRTNQIRLHCAHLGLPLVGDRAYQGSGAVPEVQTLSVSETPLCLHSWRIEFAHPISGEVMQFSAPPPSWAGKLPYTDL
jgi:UPF0176 protein